MSGNQGLALAAAMMLAASAGMMLFERSRIRVKRPLFNGRPVVTLYWVTYLSLAVLGITCAAAAIAH